MDSLPKGYHRVGHKVHATVFRKVSKEMAYFLDPNEGLFVIKGPQVGSKFFQVARHANQLAAYKHSSYNLSFQNCTR